MSDTAPMRFYGSTVLSYCCVFDLRLAVQALLQTGHASLTRAASNRQPLDGT